RGTGGLIEPVFPQAAGLKGFEPLTYRCPSDVPMERADKSRSLYLAKLQARGGAYWPSSVKRCAGARAPFQKAHGLTDIELEYLQPVATRRWWGHLEIIPGIQQTVRACVDEPERRVRSEQEALTQVPEYDHLPFVCDSEV